VSILVLCPSRGRPEKARELRESFDDTTTSGYADLLFITDEDDETRKEYPDLKTTIHRGRPGMVDALNEVAMRAVKVGRKYKYLGFVGDDHRFRTRGWDMAIFDNMERRGGGFAYGNDLLQGENLPTAVFVSTEIVQQLGYFSPPKLAHLYVDDSWKYLGDGADCLYYFPDIIIEHMHPFNGKAEWDEGYRRVNDTGVISADRFAYEEWLRVDADKDVARVKEALRQLQADVL